MWILATLCGRFFCYLATKIMQALIGQKKEQGQRFLEDGKRIPVTLIDVKGNTIVAIKDTREKSLPSCTAWF